MERKMYEPTKNQERKWGVPGRDWESGMPTDEALKIRAKKEHKPWGILKRDTKLSVMTATYEYQIGIWQGRVDAANGLEYSEDRSENTYNLGYHRGYTNFSSDFNGFDTTTQERFNKKYVEVN